MPNNIKIWYLRHKPLKKGVVFILWLFVFSTRAYSQEIPQLDTLILNNGLKVYLLPYGEGSILNVRLVIDGGKKNESACQVGYSEIIQQLIKETLKEKQNSILKKESQLSCDIRRGQTVLSGNCSIDDFNREMDLMSTAIAKLSFRHDKIHKIVSSVIERYALENLSSYRLANIYKDLILYGAKNPLGRIFCQYQLQKMLPGELIEFYFKQYTPKRSSLLVCGNFNVKAVKKIITKQFEKWKSSHHQDENAKNEIDFKIPKIKNKTIAFINNRDAKPCLLKWVQLAPYSISTDQQAFVLTCHLFEKYLAGQLKAKEQATGDTLKFKPIAYATGFMEMNCIASQNNMTKAINFFDTTLQNFNTLKFSDAELQEAIKDLKDSYLKNTTPEKILSFYDPLLYNFSSQTNYLHHLSGITVAEIQLILKKYFNPNAYKLIIVGQEHVVSNQLNLLENVSRYEASAFETCDGACVAQNKKKWKKGHMVCCFHCFIRGWCPCMYSSARLQ